MTWSPDLVTLVRIAADNHAEEVAACPGVVAAIDRLTCGVRDELSSMGVSVLHPEAMKAGLAMAVMLDEFRNVPPGEDCPEPYEPSQDLLLLIRALLDHLPPEAFTVEVA